MLDQAAPWRLFGEYSLNRMSRPKSINQHSLIWGNVILTASIEAVYRADTLCYVDFEALG